MNENLSKIISQCQSDLDKKGYCLTNIELPNEVQIAVEQKDYNSLDSQLQELTSPNGVVFKFLKSFCALDNIEFIISLREAKNSWEEDGIWHDDGSRILAFSLSLTLDLPQSGVLEFRKKGETQSNKIPTPKYGDMLVFKTGIDNFEHKINQVTYGSRLIIAGWCYPDGQLPIQ